MGEQFAKVRPDKLSIGFLPGWRAQHPMGVVPRLASFLLRGQAVLSFCIEYYTRETVRMLWDQCQRRGGHSGARDHSIRIICDDLRQHTGLAPYVILLARVNDRLN